MLNPLHFTLKFPTREATQEVGGEGGAVADGLLLT